MRVLAIYVGRFQPFHKGHYQAYKALVDKFGPDNVFIGTTDQTDPDKSPFSFSEKGNIMTGMFDIPSQNIVKVKNPYRPEEILSNYDPNSTAFVTAVGLKDSTRLAKGKYFQRFEDREGNDISPFSQQGYYITVPNYEVGGSVMSATKIRDVLGNPSLDTKKKIDFFKDVYGKFDKRFFEMMVDTITKEKKEPTMVNEPPQDQPEDQPQKSSPEKGKTEPGKEKIDPTVNQNPNILNQKVRNPITRRDILVRTALNYPPDHPVYQMARKLFKKGPTNEIFEGILLENALINQYNDLIDKFISTSRERELLRILPTDSPQDMLEKCKHAYKKGTFYYPLAHALSLYAKESPEDAEQEPANADSEGESSPIAGAAPGRVPFPDAGSATLSSQTEAMSSSERGKKFRRLNKTHVRNYLKQTVKDRVARNKDRQKAIKKYGKSKIKNKDVHHPNGPHNGNWKLVRRHHGRDRNDEEVEPSVNEGGVAGHMMHPYEDKNLTFQDYKDIIERGLIGSLGEEEPATEKLDGQNIAFTIKDGDVRFARNKGHIKNAGEKSLDITGMAKKFEKHSPEIQRAFIGAAKDLKDAMKHIDRKDLNKIFNNGQNFMSVEIILPDSENTIPYGKSVLVFHGTLKYDDEGNLIGRSIEDAKVLNDKVIDVGQERQKIFGIQGPNIISFNTPDIKKQTEVLNKFNSEVDRLKNEFSLDDNSKIADYYAKWWEREIIKEAEANGIKIPKELIAALVDRWGFDKKSRVKLTKELPPEVLQFIKEYEKSKLERAKQVSQQPFELLFLKVGSTTLERVSNFLAANNPGAVNKIKQEIDKAINLINKVDTPKEKSEKLTKELERLQTIGLDKIVPSEGIVFIYKGQPYKFTGTFAPIHQMVRTFKFKEPETAIKGEPVAPPPGKKDDQGVLKKKALIKQFYGDRITNPLTGHQITIQSALTYDSGHPARQEAVKYLTNRIGSTEQEKE